jgi:hypothetical protein
MDEQYRRKIYFLLVVGGAIVATTFVVGLLFGDRTWTSWWIQNVLHFLGGFYAFFFVRTYFLYTKAKHQIEAPPLTEIILFMAGALIMGVFWEWFELLLDRYRVFIEMKPSVMTYADNIGDLVTDTLGAIVAGIYVWKRKPQ